MKISICILLSLTFLAGCRTGADIANESEATVLRIPKWSFLVRASASFDKDYKEVPKRVYVFPALRLNTNGQPIDQLSPRQMTDGALQWYSQAPLGSQLKVVVENKLSKEGFRPISFQEMMDYPEGHSILVFNLYYAETSASKDNPTADPDSSWTTFTRITAATFPQDLNPQAKRDIMNQEVVTLFNDREKGAGVIKRSANYLLDYMGITRQWSESVNLLL
jgi:hypothetical protein